MDEYDLNSAPRFTGTYKNASAVLTDPTVATASYTKPNGTTTTLTYGTDVALVKSSTGVYYVDLTLDQTGRWNLTFAGTGTVTASDPYDFIVGTTHAYCALDEFNDYLGPTAAGSSGQISASLNAASRWVDSKCGRQFWLEPTAVARTYVPDSLYCIDVADIGSTTGLVIATDATGDGTFETTWSASDYQLLPPNAPLDGPEPRPWTAIKAVGTHTFPWIGGAYLRRTDRVQVTARWGWPAIPDAVVQATLIKAARLFHRKNSPQGVIAFDEFGAVRLGRGEDSDVLALLAEYMLDPILMA